MKETINVGILHSLTGTLAISEQSLVDAELMAIDEINANGGVLDKLIQPIIADGQSNSSVFAEKAMQLIQEDQVATIFGCWTSACRKAVLPIFEAQNHLLWYPVQYEGQECSPNIFYIGATPNQQIEPAVDWLLKYQGDRFYLIGSDYVFPYTANQIIKARVMSRGGQILGEDYVPLGSQNFADIINRIQATMPNGGIIFNTINGDSNVAFYQQLQQAGLGSDRYTVMAASVAEQEILSIGWQYCIGHYSTWNYFQSVETLKNQEFVQNFKRKYGNHKVTSDPIEAAYVMVYLWRQAVAAAGTTDIPLVKAAAIGQSFEAPSGNITIQSNHHCSKVVRIGKVRADGQFQIVYATEYPIEPIPWNQHILSKATEELWQKNCELQNTYSQLQKLNLDLEKKAQQLEETLLNLETAQNQLIHTEKMSSLGQMLAGVAHEINNPLSFIYSNLNYAHNYCKSLLELVKLYPQYYPNLHPEINSLIAEIDLDFLSQDLPRMLNSMKLGAERIRQIVLSMENFSRLDKTEKEFVDIHESIDSTLSIFQHRLQSDQENLLIQVEKNYGNVPLVACYPRQLKQVLMNVLSNAIDALQEKTDHSHKIIKITTEISDEHQIKIAIQDNGLGIPEELKSKLFDPFFTTKPVGKGTGLGLTICYQIMEKHQGNIQIYSEPPLGTEVIITLPRQI